MFLDSQEKNECYGCTSCASICPKQAIEMSSDERGFLYPHINESLCVDCNLCRKACDFCKVRDNINAVKAAYGVKHKSLDERKRSRSGGAFMAIAQSVIKNGGVCWGAAFDSNLDVVHTCAASEKELHKLQGSKYVQSDLSKAGCFRHIAQQLSDGCKVLFSGTACQVAGLLQYLKTKKCNIDNLLTCDIVCQGVPSPQLYKDYRDYLENKYHDKLKDFNFRDKARIGWGGHEESFSFLNHKSRIYSRRYATYYYYYMRQSCFSVNTQD